jgi:hypothetical protein
MPRWRWALLTLLAVIALAWSALFALWVADALVADCANAASEVSDPCAYGQFTYIAVTVGIWLVGATILAFSWVILWRRRR